METTNIQTSVVGRNGFYPGICTALLFLVVGFSGVANSDGIEDGQKYVMATHSFNVFIGPRTNRQTGDSSAGPLAALAKESGKSGHENLAVPNDRWIDADATLESGRGRRFEKHC